MNKSIQDIKVITTLLSFLSNERVYDYHSLIMLISSIKNLTLGHKTSIKDPMIEFFKHDNEHYYKKKLANKYLIVYHDNFKGFMNEYNKFIKTSMKEYYGKNLTRVFVNHIQKL